MLNFKLIDSFEERTYSQTINFIEISNGVWFEVPPPNITAPIGKETNYPFPKLIINGGSLLDFSLNYPSLSISATWVPLASKSTLILSPIDG